MKITLKMSKKKFNRQYGRMIMRTINWRQQEAKSLRDLRNMTQDFKKRRFIFIRNVLVKSLFKHGIDGLIRIKEKEYKLIPTVPTQIRKENDLNTCIAIDKEGREKLNKLFDSNPEGRVIYYRLKTED